MSIKIRAYTAEDTASAIALWNHVVTEGIAFPQEDCLTCETGHRFFSEQSYTGVAYVEATGEIVGLYILHPNNVGRVGHICNCSYTVKLDCQGQHIGETLVRHSLAKGKELGYRIMQFNAVVKTNWPARHLYEKIGFEIVGVIKGGFLMKNGVYEDIVVYAYYL